MKIYSEVGVGTTVRLYLRRAEESALPAAAQQAERVAGGNESVLVVEDNEMVRNLLVAQLNSLGYKTHAAPEGRTALKMLESGLAVDLLLTDVVMPGGMSGVDLWLTVKDKRPGLRVLFASGFTEASQREGAGAMPEGAAFLNKPYRKAELAAKLREALAVPPLAASTSA